MRNMQELNRAWYRTVRLTAGANGVFSSFVLVIFLVQIFALQVDASGQPLHPEAYKMAKKLGCAACIVLWSTMQFSRFVLIHSLCKHGRHDPTSSFVQWEAQMESGVIAQMLSQREGGTLGTPSQVAAEGCERCRAIHLSALGEGVFRNDDATVWSEEDGVQRDASGAGKSESFACPRPDFFVSHSWRDDPSAKYQALKLIARAGLKPKRTIRSVVVAVYKRHGRSVCVW